ncbi:MAG: 4Fe-4S dicluster domain-containing protein [Bacteroidales bacterium]|nr:4Fe-4S dicluster domain-containing protein [Bacteroidales bacterium]
MNKKISIISHESPAGRTLLAHMLFEAARKNNENTLQLMGYDIEKPDLLNYQQSLRFDATEVFAGFPRIDKDHCRYCGACVSYCECGALHLNRDIPKIEIDPDKCEACGDCLDGCSIHGISRKERLTGYILQGRSNGNFITIGKGEDHHDFLLPLVCALDNYRMPGAISICDLGPGMTGKVKIALKNTSLAVIMTRAIQGWERNVSMLREELDKSNIRYSIVVNYFRDEKTCLDEIKNYAALQNIPFLGVIPFLEKLNHENSSTFTALDSELEPIFAQLWKNILQAIPLKSHNI